MELSRISFTNAVIFNNKNFSLLTTATFLLQYYLLLSLFEKSARKLKRRLIKELRIIDVTNSITSLKWLCQTSTPEYF